MAPHLTPHDEQTSEAGPRSPRFELVSGNRMVALGALASGCEFFSGYPITPSSEIYQVMIEELPRREGLALAAPDEISALCGCVGASMTGHRAMTATSGPGWCLMIETVQYALMTETPVVIVVVQRLGPSTGGATQGGQGDVLLTQFCTSGGYTIPLFAPSNARECYELTQLAFAWSERLRMPVVVLSDKEVGMTLESVDVAALAPHTVPERTRFTGQGRYVPYACDCAEAPPPFAPVGGEIRVVATGSAHDREGRLRKNSPEVIDILLHLEAKVTAHAEEMALVDADLDDAADTLLLSYGISARAARQACLRLRAEGRPASFLQVKTLFPLPVTAIRHAAARSSARRHCRREHARPVRLGHRVPARRPADRARQPRRQHDHTGRDSRRTRGGLMAFTYALKDAPLPYCKGCGHGFATRALGDALTQLQLPPSDVVIVTDIGCVGLAESLFNTPHIVHTTHGRSSAFAIGLSLADSVLGRATMKPVVLIGDGGATIGINHLLNGALLNADVTVLVHNNFLFGMTGGQNSALSPLDLVTATTPDGNSVPPMDLARVLIASRASFVARKLASDRDLADVIARAIAHPGFSIVEILELCTGFATKWNPLTGSRLAEVAAKAGYELGVLFAEARPTFGQTYLSRPAVSGRGKSRKGGAATGARHAGAARNIREQRLVVGGTAGERVQTAAGLLAAAAMGEGLHVTQKNDYPVTQGTGFSVSEIILGPEEILFTGVERPDAILVVSSDGARELGRSGVFGRVTDRTIVLADTDVAIPDLPCRVERFSFRRTVGPKMAALAAVARWLALTGALPLDALWRALDARFGVTPSRTRRPSPRRSSFSEVSSGPGARPGGPTGGRLRRGAATPLP